jgi:hypothetical protein
MGHNDDKSHGRRSDVSVVPVLTRLMFPEAIAAGHCGEIPLFAVRDLYVCWSGTVRLHSPKPHVLGEGGLPGSDQQRPKTALAGK